ncbi:BglG family transcription antiterminator [uncultured Fusobacterium sp.]|uniref:BglG family transcription antiterminator n=1 Tax=uncultured Fusobacterium sp. TaxID=159267 RepID=UPI0025D8CC61|nr:BglG family transcription antiterminator [uncultured Fusobacterium sp.]
MLSRKSIDLLHFLLKEKRNVSLKELSDNFHLSERSIRYEIEKIQKELSAKDGFEFIISKGECFVDDYTALEKYLNESRQDYIFSPKEREIYILLKICFEREINQNIISEELDTSRSTIKVHLRDIKKVLDEYNLELELLHKKGLGVTGEEEKIRQCTLKIMNMVKKANSSFLKNILDNYFEEIDIEGVKLFINYCQKLMNKIVSDEAFDIISKYLILAIYFNKKGHKITSIKNCNFLKNTSEFECVEKSRALLEGFYEIELSEEEYLKITDYFLGSHTYNISYSYYENWVEIEMIVKNFINRINEKLDVNISADETLMTGLVNHIKPTIYRLKNGIELENTIYEEVVESYPNLFSLIKGSVGELEDFIDNKFTNDEIAFITIHFKAAIDRNIKKKREKVKVLVVCGSGYGSSKLLAQQLKDMYRVEIIDTIPRYLLEKVNKRTDIDLILTTIPLDDFETDKTIIKVNPILNKEDMAKLDNYPISRDSKKIIFSELVEVIEKNSKIKADDKLLGALKAFLDSKLIDDLFHKKITISDLLSEKRIKLKGKASNWREAIREAGELLLKDGCIEEEYIDNMIKLVDDFGNYIMLIPNVIFPHTKSKDLVKKTAFSIVTYNKRIDFLDEGKIGVVICFCVKDEREHLDGLIEIVEKIEENNLEEKIRRSKTAKDVIKYLTN